LNKVKKAILWDFDGTLYSSKESYLNYSKCISDLSGEKYENFSEECMRVINDHEKYIAEDGWAIIAKLAREKGFEKVLDPCFNLTREKMNKGEIRMILNKEAIEIIRNSNVYHILATNTPEKYAKPMLIHFGIEFMFNKIYYSSKKPYGLEEISKDFLNMLDIAPQDVLSIGDNYINDIIPSLKIGFKTVFIQSYPRKSDSHLSVNNFKKAIPFIEKFLEL
jgi:putative hydrolase of the HAD superfamily